jgi:hypothetical protein
MILVLLTAAIGFARYRAIVFAFGPPSATAFKRGWLSFPES